MSYYFVIVGAKDTPLFEHEFGTSKAGGDGQARFRPEARHMNQFIVHASLDIVEEVQWTTGQMYLKHIDRFHNNFVSCFLTPSNTRFLLLYNPDAHISSGFAGGAGTPGNPIASLSPPNTTKTRPSILSRTSTTADQTSNGFTYSPPKTSTSTSISSSSTSSTPPPSKTTTTTTTATATATATTNFNPTAPVTEEAHRAFFADVFDAWIKTVMNPFYAVDAGVPMPVRNPVFRNKVAAAGKKFL